MKQKRVYKYIFVFYFLLLFIITTYHYTNTKKQVAGISTTTTETKPKKNLQLDVFYPSIIATPTPTRTAITSVPSISPTIPNISITPTTTPANNPINIGDLINSVSEDKIKEYLNHLTSNSSGTRWSGYGEQTSNPNGNWAETKYVKDFFENQEIQSSFQNFTTHNGGHKTRNVIGRILGEKTNEFYLLTAHIDSISSARNPAPGADDNGSGTAVVMEVARVLKNSGIRPKASLEFVLFSGEEQGLEGSYYYVGNQPAEIIKGVINIDMIGNNGSSGDCVGFGFKPYNGGDILSNKILEINNRFNIGLTSRSYESSNGRSDHKPFWDIGTPAIFGHECDFSPVYHSTQDKTDKINYKQLTKTAKAIAGAIANLANE